MRIIRLGPLTMAEAEEAIAILWCILEEHRILTPRLNVHRVAGAVDLSVEFLSQEDADLVRQVARRSRAGGLATAAGPKLC